MNKNVKAGRVEILRATTGEHYVRYIAKNGRVLATSETFHRIEGAKKNIKSMRKLLTSKAEIITPDSTQNRKP
jgi:uncharacterized protein YegP (UPF0339 family)